MYLFLQAPDSSELLSLISAYETLTFCRSFIKLFFCFFFKFAHVFFGTLGSAFESNNCTEDRLLNMGDLWISWFNHHIFRFFLNHPSAMRINLKLSHIFQRIFNQISQTSFDKPHTSVALTSFIVWGEQKITLLLSLLSSRQIWIKHESSICSFLKKSLLQINKCNLSTRYVAT